MSEKPVRIAYWQRRIVYICPKCGKPLVFRKVRFGTKRCALCGQDLDWSPTDKIQTETVTAEDATDAAIIAERYFQACGIEESEWFNLDEFRRSLSRRGRTELYLYFKDPKEYGRFKRLNGGKK